jgi:type II secretion system protein L
MSRKVLGIDIRKHSIVAVMVSGGVRENRIEACADIPIPADTDETDNGIAAAFETLAQTIDTSDCDCVVSFPSAWFSYRNIQVPFGNHRKIRMVLPFELEPTLPYQIDELELDFQTIDTPQTGENTNLIAAAIEKSKLDPLFETMKSHKIDPECATISGLPAALCLARQADPGEDQLFIDIDERSSTLFATVGGRIQLVRSFPLPPAAATQSKMLGSQIQRTLAAFEEIELPEFEPLEIFIFGNGLADSNHIEEITALLNTTVQPADLTERLSVTIEDKAADTWDATQMENALALTLMEINDLKTLNFHRGQFAVQKFLTKNKPQVIRTAILAAAVLALFVITATIEFYTLYKKTSHLDRQLAEIYQSTFPGAKIIQDPYQEMNARIQEARKKSAFNKQTGPHVRRIDILNSISKSIPKEIEVDITRLVISPQNVLIAGNTDDINYVDDIRGKLEQIDFFKKVSISSSNMDRSGKEVRFILKAEL